MDGGGFSSTRPADRSSGLLFVARNSAQTLGYRVPVDYHARMNRRPSWTSWLAAASLAICVPIVDGCTSRTTGSDLCDQTCDCESCPDDVRAECKTENVEAEDVALEEGCEAEYEAYYECLNSEFRCEDGEAETAQCARELAELRDCAPDATPGPKGCAEIVEALNDKFRECSPETIPEEDPNVVCDQPGQEALLECLAPCYLGLTCDELLNSPEAVLACAVPCIDLIPPPSTGTGTTGTGSDTGTAPGTGG